MAWYLIRHSTFDCPTEILSMMAIVTVKITLDCNFISISLECYDIYKLIPEIEIFEVVLNENVAT